MLKNDLILEACSRPEFVAHFWERVDKGEGCWTWNAGTDTNGYGVVWLGACRKNALAHRVAWTLANGRIPDELDVLHSCDNTSCVGIHHLFLGTHLDNMHDRDRKGRGALPGFKGEQHGMAKLTEDAVRDIRSKRGIVDGNMLAAQYGVARVTIYQVWRRKLWAHVK